MILKYEKLWLISISYLEHPALACIKLEFRRPNFAIPTQSLYIIQQSSRLRSVSFLQMHTFDHTLVFK